VNKIHDAAAADDDEIDMEAVRKVTAIPVRYSGYTATNINSILAS